MAMIKARDFGWGEPVPWFRAPALDGSPAYEFGSAAGRYVLLLFLGSTALEQSARALRLVLRHREIFDDRLACFFGVTTDPADAEEGRIAQTLPGIRFFLDYDGEVSRVCGALSGADYRPHWLLLDPRLRVLRRLPVREGEQAIELLRQSLKQPFPQDSWAPVLLLPNVFEPELCEELIALFEADGGHPSGFVREVDGKTTLITDPSHKQRRDFDIADAGLRERLSARIVARISPALKQAFQFEPTHIERYIVSCYRAGAGHFRPHRDNTTKGTAHRKFAVTINLNAGEYEGGDLRFPEFGPRTYVAPTGGAIIFSCSLLHEATPVTRGKRYAFLPFLYDQAGASLRRQNAPYLSDNLGRI